MKQRLIKHIFFWFSLATAVLLFFSYCEMRLSTDNEIRILKGETHYVNFSLPFVYIKGDRDGIIKFNGDEIPTELSLINPPYNLEAMSLGKVNLELSLFGRIPLRQITINVIPEVRLLPGGHSIGIKLFSQGVSVVGYYYFQAGGQSISPGRDAGIKIGDTILEINGEEADNVSRAARLLEKGGSAPIDILVLRDERKIMVTLKPVYSFDDESYRIGLYIRDSAAGVGTLTFYDPRSHRFGALGHVIMDSDTHKPVNLSNGTIVKAKIVDIKKAERGQPGEKTGLFLNQDRFSGAINRNCRFGIFGQIESFNYSDGSCSSPYPEPIPMALASQVESGPAEILTVVDGEQIDSYDIEIERVSMQNQPSDKGLIIRIVDKKLLDLTGGIIQGMSGSPIIQDGRLAGAVTHVFVNDPTRGYGIFMEWMHQEAKIME